MTHAEKALAGRVIQWAYKGTGYNGLIPKDQIDSLVKRFDQDDWEREIREWGDEAMMLDPMSYSDPDTPWQISINIFKAKILKRIGERAGDTEPYLGRTTELLKLYNIVASYKLVTKVSS